MSTNVLEKLKFLLVYNKNISTEFALISFNEIIMELSSNNKKNIKLRHNNYKNAYRYDRTFKGVRDGSIEVRAIGNGKDRLDIDETIINNAELEGKYKRVLKKFEMAGLQPNITVWDWGFVSYDATNLGYLNNNCIGLTIGDGSFINKRIGNVCISARNLWGLHGIEIDSLVESWVEIIADSELSITNTLYSAFVNLENSNIIFGNVHELFLGRISKGSIEINNGINITFNDILESKIKFNCDVGKHTIKFPKSTYRLYKTKLVFLKRVSISILRKLVDNTAKDLAEEFKIVLNSDEYKKCIKRMKPEYRVYLDDGGKSWES